MTAGNKSGSATYATRRERRASQRAAHKTADRTAPRQSAWRSPMVMLTAAAVILGALIVGYAFLTQPPPPTDALNAPQFDVPAGLSDGRSLGSAGAPVTVDIWADFQCPGCRALATRVEPPIISQFVATGYARLAFHDAAFQGRKVSATWDESVQAAAAARCAADQGRFWQMHDWLFANWNGENEGAFRPERLRQIADSAELDTAAYDKCMAVGDKQASVKADTDSAAAAGITFTPAIAINGAAYMGAVTVKDLGDAIMAATGGASPAPQGSVAP